MMIFRSGTLLLYAVALLLSVCSCNNTPKEATPITLRQDDGFLTYTGSFSNDKVAINSVSYANQISGEVLLEFNLLNKTAKPLIVKYLLTELATEDGIRCSPEFTEDLAESLAPGQEASYALKYFPTNSRRLFSEIEYRGDLKETYQLDLEFIGIKGQKLNLKANPEAYENYISHFAQEKNIRIYQIANQEAWSNQQSKCAKKVSDKTQASSISIHDKEVLIQGVVCKMWLYQLGETLNFSLRLANQSEQLINGIPEKLVLEHNGIVLTPQNIDVLTINPKNRKGEGVVLRKSERYQIDYSFEIKEESTDVTLKNLGVFLSENKQDPLICYPLTFTIPAS